MPRPSSKSTLKYGSLLVAPHGTSTREINNRYQCVSGCQLSLKKATEETSNITRLGFLLCQSGTSWKAMIERAEKEQDPSVGWVQNRSPKRKPVTSFYSNSSNKISQNLIPQAAVICMPRIIYLENYVQM